jgi:hypothetical protein
MTVPMHVVILQVSIAHDDFPPEQVPERYRVSKVVGEVKATHMTFEREIQLPFVPCTTSEPNASSVRSSHALASATLLSKS